MVEQCYSALHDRVPGALSGCRSCCVAFPVGVQKLTLETENEIKFNSNYQALYRQLKEVYAKIGASDFYGVVGENFESRRHEKV